MTIASIFIGLIFIVQIMTLASVLYLVRHIKSSESSSQKRFQRAMDKVVALEPSTSISTEPNEASEKKDDGEMLDENVPWDIPDDVKITVEGGDSHTPPGYEVS